MFLVQENKVSILMVLFFINMTSKQIRLMLLHFKIGLTEVANQEISMYVWCYLLGFITNLLRFNLVFHCSFSYFRTKFNNADDVIRLSFLFGSFLVGSKTWWHLYVRNLHWIARYDLYLTSHGAHIREHKSYVICHMSQIHEHGLHFTY